MPINHVFISLSKIIPDLLTVGPSPSSVLFYTARRLHRGRLWCSLWLPLLLHGKQEDKEPLKALLRQRTRGAVLRLDSGGDPSSCAAGAFTLPAGVFSRRRFGVGFGF